MRCYITRWNVRGSNPFYLSVPVPRVSKRWSAVTRPMWPGLKHVCGSTVRARGAATTPLRQQRLSVRRSARRFPGWWRYRDLNPDSMTASHVSSHWTISPKRPKVDFDGLTASATLRTSHQVSKVLCAQWPLMNYLMGIVVATLRS